MDKNQDRFGQQLWQPNLQAAYTPFEIQCFKQVPANTTRPYMPPGPKEERWGERDWEKEKQIWLHYKITVQLTTSSWIRPTFSINCKKHLKVAQLSDIVQQLDWHLMSDFQNNWGQKKILLFPETWPKKLGSVGVFFFFTSQPDLPTFTASGVKLLLFKAKFEFKHQFLIKKYFFNVFDFYFMIVQ